MQKYGKHPETVKDQHFCIMLQELPAQKITLDATKWPSLQPFRRLLLDSPQVPVYKLKSVFCTPLCTTLHKVKAHQINSRQWEQKVG
jgi:hypothetical protein